MTKIFFSRENESVILPSKRDTDAGYDLYVDPEYLNEVGGVIKINPNETVMIPTGIRSVIDSGYYAQIQERGSTGTKGMKYGAGVIDSNFRGVWNVVITNCSEKTIAIMKDIEDGVEGCCCNKLIKYPANKGIAQCVILPVPKVEIEEISKEDLLKHESVRGEGLLGSSGK